MEVCGYPWWLQAAVQINLCLRLLVHNAGQKVSSFPWFYFLCTVRVVGIELHGLRLADRTLPRAQPIDGARKRGQVFRGRLRAAGPLLPPLVVVVVEAGIAPNAERL